MAEDNQSIIPVFSEEELFSSGEEEMNIVSAGDLGIEDPPENTPPNTDEPPANPEDQDNVYRAVYNTLIDDGILFDDNPSEFKGDAESLKGKLKDIAEFEKAKIYHNSPDILKPIVEFALSAQNTLTKDELKDFVNTYMEDVSQPTSYTQIDSIDEARAFLTSKFKDTLDDDAIVAALDVLEDKEEGGKALLSKANSLKEGEFNSNKDRYKDKIKDKVAQEAQLKETEEAFVSKVVDELDSTGWDKRRVNRLKRELAGNVTNNTLQTALASPKALIQLANLMTYYDNKSGNFNFEAFVKQIVSKDLESIKDRQNEDYFSSLSTQSTPTRGKMDVNKFLDNPNFKPIIE